MPNETHTATAGGPALSMVVLRASTLIIGFTGLYYGLASLGAALIGAGHGSPFFFMAALAPFSLMPDLAWFGLALWSAVGLLLALRHFQECRLLARIILGVHYVGVLAVSLLTDWEALGKAFQNVPYLVVLFFIGYIGSQTFFWILIARK